jgi:hypothetical protein
MRSDVVAGALILTAAAVVAGWLVVRDYQSFRASLRDEPLMRVNPPTSPQPLSAVPTTQSSNLLGAPRLSAAPQRSFRGGRAAPRRGRNISPRQSSAAPLHRDASASGFS